MMGKRLVCLVLVLVLTVYLLPLPAQADENNDVFITIQAVETDAEGNKTLRNRLLHVLENGDDLLFSARDLAEISGFYLDMAIGNTLTFTRGYKVVSVDLATSKVKLYDSQNPDTVCSPEAELPSKVVIQGDQYYLSAAGMLPRLNVNCALDDGLLSIVPAPVSLWDFIHDVNLTDYCFDTAYCAEVLGCSEKHIQSLLHAQNDLSDSIIYYIDPDFATEREYYVIFDRFIKDETVTDKTLKELNELAQIVSSVSETPDECIEWFDDILPGCSDFFSDEFMDGLGDAAETIGAATDIILYYNMFAQDNSQKVSVMDSFIASNSHRNNPNIITAAKQIKLKYTNFWLGLMFSAGYDFIYDYTDEITFERFREVFRVDYMNQLPDNELLEQTQYFQYIIYLCRLNYRKGFDPTSRKDIKNWYAHAMLYFYSVEQLYWGMAQHVIDMRGGTREQLKEFKRTAGKMETMYAKYLASSIYINNDLFDNGFLEKKSTPHLQYKCNTISQKIKDDS